MSDMQNLNVKDIDSYIACFPEKTQEILTKIRETIKQAAPEAEETISYQIPTFRLNGNLVHFAAYNHHIGFYPTPSGIEYFKEELSSFKGAKGSVQFPVNEEIPYDLIMKIVRFRVKENIEKGGKKASKAKMGKEKPND